MAGPLVAVWSPKGGVGRTLVAAGLAMAMARRTGRRALLIDLNAAGAAVAPLLQTGFHPSVLEYATTDSQSINHPLGIAVLPGPARLVDEALITADVARAVLDRAAAADVPVVIDLDATLRDANLVTLERADVVVLVVTPDLLSLYLARRFRQEAELIGLDLTRFRLVINQTGPRLEVGEQEMRTLVDLPLAGQLPYMPGMASAIIRGMSSMSLRSHTQFAQAMRGVTRHLGLGVEETARAPRTERASGLRAGRMRRPGLIGALQRWWRSL